MSKHAIALGYFFLAGFCIHVGQNGPTVLNSILTTAGILACLVGGVFFVAASITQLQAVTGLLAKLIRKAQQPPVADDK